MKIRRLAALLALSIPLAACVSSDDSVAPSPNPNAGFQARFTPLGGVMPFPNDLYFDQHGTGQLGIPGSAAVAQNGPLLELNHLDGFGTQSDINIYFTAPVKASTLAANVFVFKVTSDVATKAVTGFSAPLAVGTDYSIGLSPGIDSNGQIVTIKPLHPLAASTVSGGVPVPATYLVVVTKGVTDASGAPASASSDYSAIVAADTPALATLDVKKIAMSATDPLLPVAQFTLPQLAVAAGAGITPDKVAVTFSFSTQYEGVALASMAATAQPTTQPTGVGTIDTHLRVCDALFQSGKLPNNTTACSAVVGSDATEIYAGTVAIPYYLPVPSATKPTAALTGSWKNSKGGDIRLDSSNPTGSFTPKATVAQNVIPVIVTIPTGCGAMPGTGWPVTVFQHGITRNREDVFGIASTFGHACIAMVSIDLPLHGVTNKADPLYTAGHERTFDMDLQNNSSGASGPDGKLDSSGAWFINLNSTITSRDNLREGAADLINLMATLPNMFPGGTNAFDTSKVFFVGHSLGGIIGTVYLGADTAGASLTGHAPKIVAATLAAPGGHIAELLRNSPSFEPIIDAGLAQQGLVKDSQAYFDFYSEAQAVVEDGDPANYAAIAAAGHPIHMMEVVGGFSGAADTCNLPDQVVPNSATDLLSSTMGLVQVDTTTPGSKFIVRFLTGDHGSILDPSVPSNCPSNATTQGLYGATTVEMQTEAVAWMLANGLQVTINNTPPIIKAP